MYEKVGNMDQNSITPNTSNQQLVINGDNDSATALLQEKQARRENLRDVTFVEYMTVFILCYVNLINYMDRFTLAGKWNQNFLYIISRTFQKLCLPRETYIAIL